MMIFKVEGFTEETSVMLDLPPDRIGHGTCIHPDYGGTQILLGKTRAANIPLGESRICDTFHNNQALNAPLTRLFI